MFNDPKLIFVDVDDTLFDKPSLSIPQTAVDGLIKAKECGHKIFINTGRPYAYLEKVILSIPFDGYVCSNGVDIIIDGETIFYQALSLEDTILLGKLAKDHHVVGALQGRNGIFFTNEQDDFHPYYATLLHDFRRSPYMPHDFSWDHVKSCEKGIFFGNETSDMPGLIDAVSHSSLAMTCVVINDTQLEIIQDGYDKGTGILAVADYYGLTADDCYVFGDSNNDLEMFTAAGHSIAMGNSSPELKAQADWVTRDILDHGLYYGLVHEQLIPNTL